jgi:segregation and condensation protein A
VALLRVRPSIQLAELIANELSRVVIIVTFLAVLELWKRGRVCVQQAALFDPIILERGERWSEDDQVDEEEIEFDA